MHQSCGDKYNLHAKIRVHLSSGVENFVSFVVSITNQDNLSKVLHNTDWQTGKGRPDSLRHFIFVRFSPISLSRSPQSLLLSSTFNKCFCHDSNEGVRHSNPFIPVAHIFVSLTSLCADRTANYNLVNRTFFPRHIEMGGSRNSS